MSDPYAPSYTQPGQGAVPPAAWAAPGAPQFPAPSQLQSYAQQYYAQQYAQQQGYGYYPGPVLPPSTSPLTIAALVIGIVAAVISLVPLLGLVSYIMGPLAVVLGIVGLAKGLHRRGFAVTGVVTGAFALLVCILYTLLLPTLLMIASSDTEAYGFEVDSAGAFQTIVITDNLLAPEITDHQGSFSATMEASPLVGAVTAVNAVGNTGEISCVIHDEEGTVLVEDYAYGAGAQVQCLLSEAWGMAPDEAIGELGAGSYLR